MTNTVNLNNLSPVKQSPDHRLNLRKVNDWTDSRELPETIDREEVVALNEANVICSDFNKHWNFGEEFHMPVLDIDRGMVFWESSTPGHYSVIFKTDRLSRESYFKLLDVMVECGILEEGYVNAAKQRGYTAVRLPWIKKGNDDSQEAPY